MKISKFNNKNILIAIALLAGIGIGYLLSKSDVQEIDHSSHDHSNAVEIWTCSMHPQVRLPEPGQCPICGMSLIPATSGNTNSNTDPLIHQMTPQAVAMSQIQTTKVRSISPEGEIFLSGKVKADEQRLASITAKYPGRIERLYINFTGQVVRRGERLATIYSPEILIAQKELQEAKISQSSFPELYAAAREKLRFWNLNENQIDQIENSTKVQELFEVLADKSGVVIQRNVSVGDYINTGSVLFTIADLSRVWIMLDAYERDLSFVKIGDEISFEAAGISGKTFKAKVEFIDPIIDTETRTVSVRAEIPNSNMELKPEMFVTAKVKTTIERGASSLAIPRTALLWSGKRSIVYVKVPHVEQPSFEMKEITIGPRMGDMWLVEDGLEIGAEVVTNGVFAIDASAQLSSGYSMMQRPEYKTMNVPIEFRKQITSVAEAYFDIKNNLVKSDAVAVVSESGRLNDALNNVHVSFSGEAYDIWIRLSKEISTATKKIGTAKNLVAQREHFATLSQSIIEMTEYFGLEKNMVYMDYCPMAFNNKGAYWLSEFIEIKNPYFGDEMLDCGEVLATYLQGQLVINKMESVNPLSGHSH